MKTIILAAGSGTRLKPLTETMSKPMIPIANKPLLQWLIDAVDVFSEEILIVIRNDQKDITDHFKDFPKITFVYQDNPLGTAHAVGCCERYLKDYDGPILKLNGDDMISLDDINRISRLDGCYAGAVHSTEPEKLGIFHVEDGYVKFVEEKPEKPITDLSSCGMYLLNKRIFEFIRKTPLSKRGEYELTDSINMFIKEEKMRVSEVNRWITITYPWQLLDAHKLILDQIGTQIGQNVEIKPGTHIEYPVAIGEGSVIGPNCFIRRYSTIGKKCKIGNAVEIKNSIVMDNSYVSHLSYVGDSIIGKNCNIGAGSIFANLRLDDNAISVNVNGSSVNTGKRKLGGVVGDNVRFGVNVTVMPGKRIWPNMRIPPCTMIIRDVTVQPDMKSDENLTRNKLS